MGRVFKLGRKGLAYQEQLLDLVDEDTKAFNKIMDAFKLPKESTSEKEKRNNAIQEATKNAILTPFKVMEVALNSMDVIKKMAEIGNPNSITDACVAGLCARTSIRGAFLNVKINCLDYNDKSFVDKITIKGEKILDSALKLEEDITAITEKIMQS